MQRKKVIVKEQTAFPLYFFQKGENVLIKGNEDVVHLEIEEKELVKVRIDFNP